MLRRTFLALGTATVALAVGGNIALAGTLETIKARNKLVVAVMQDYPPWGSIGPDMQPVGIDIDIAKYMAKKLGVGLELVPTSGANRIPFMQTGKADIIIACLGKNAEREKVVSFSEPYIAEFLGVYGDVNNSVSKPADLSGQKIGASRGGSEDLAVTAIAPKGTSIQRFEDTAQTLGAYTAGQVDMVTMGSSTASTFNMTAPRKLYLRIKMSDEPAYIGVPKDDQEMLDVANQTIAAMAADGTLTGLAKKYLGDASAAVAK